jgi:VCBS repeat protein
MKLAIPFLVVGFLGSSAVPVEGQRARLAANPSGDEGEAFLATRFLGELATSPPNTGVFAKGDLDNDGDVDLLACERPSFSHEPTGIQVWRNEGQGDFNLVHRVDFDPWTSTDYFSIARQLFVADITGDGVLDLAYERSQYLDLGIPSGVLVHAGVGDCSFGPGLLLATNGPVQEFLVGDADGDGDADLLLNETNTGTDYMNTLAWWRLEGGTFVSGVALQVDAETPLRMTAMDVDGDGITDAAAGTFNGYGALQVFRTVDGAPTLLTSVPLPSELHNINQRQLIGDIDGDGREDVLLELDHPSTDVFYFQPILGTATGFALAPMQSFANAYPEPPLSRDGVLADWDADGDLDFVSPTFSWMENRGGARFEPAGQQLSRWSGNGNRTPMHVLDLDGDGHLDALAATQLYRGDGTFPRRSSLPAYTDTLVTNWTQAEDWEGDGDLDLVSEFGQNLNNGDGTFVTRNTYFSVPNAFDVRVAGWDDFDGDGLRDLLVASFLYPPFRFDRMTLFTGTESSGYVASPIVPSSVEITGVKSGDLDGDGDVDVLAINGYWANDGQAYFGSAPVAAYAGEPLVARDVDGDDDLDLLVRAGGRLKLLLNLGGLAFASTDFGVHASGSLSSFQDADEDGDLDLLVVEPSNAAVVVREQLPGGGFAAPLVLLVTGANGNAGLIDVNGDGRLDLVTPGQVPFGVGSVQVLAAWIRGQGLSYAHHREWVTREPPRAYGDIDGDGDVDALGSWHFRNYRFDGRADGTVLQYGLAQATPGTGGRHPILGSAGPARPGQPAELSLARGRGHASGVLMLGKERDDVLDGGIRLLVHAPVVVHSLVLDGAPGVAGAGSTVVSLPVSPALVGRTMRFQAVLVDPGASNGLSASNGLEIVFGRPGP